MSEHEAQIYVDLVLDTLHDWGVISPEKYGRMTEDHRQKLAKLVAAKSEE